MTIHIGTSGWSYDHWEGVIYPYGAPQRDRLAYYVQHFLTVEINSTYYHLPADATFLSWRRRVPEAFRITIKAPRGLTHAARLYAPEAWLARITRSLNVVLPPEHDLLERVRRINVWCHEVGAHQSNLCKYQLLVRYNALHTPPETPFTSSQQHMRVQTNHL
jgi:hypothetical protein